LIEATGQKHLLLPIERWVENDVSRGQFVSQYFLRLSFRLSLNTVKKVDLVIEGIGLELFSYSYQSWTCWGYLKARVSVRQMEILKGQFFLDKVKETDISKKHWKFKSSG